MRLIARVVTGLSIVLLLASCGVWLLLSAPRAGLEALTIPTGSMHPTMPAGSLALVRQVPIAAVHVGDIITYADPFNPHKTITHRVIKTYMIADKVPGFMTKGDANTAADLPIPGGSVQGRVIWHVPYLGRVLSWARSWAGIAVLVYLPALLVMIEEIKRLRDYYRLSLPYRLVGYRREPERRAQLPKLAAAPLAGAVMTGVIMAQPVASALSMSNTTALTDNHISVATASPPPNCQSETNASVNDSSSQAGGFGSADADGGGSASPATPSIPVGNVGC